MDIRKNLSTERVIRHWKSSPRAVVEFPYLGASKIHEDIVLRSMVQLRVLVSE